MRKVLFGFCLFVALSASGAEKFFDFSKSEAGKIPAGFRSTLAGEGKPGNWQVIMDDVPPLLSPLTDKAPAVTRRAVLAQLDADPTDERFPMLVFEEETFADFTLTTRFKLVSGETEQMAGIVFRYRDAKNFYVIRVSGLGRNVAFYKVINGLRTDPIRVEATVPTGEWQELSIECRGNQTICMLNGKKALPTLTDNSNEPGLIGYWTKSDAVTYFADTRIVYRPREIPAKAIVRDMIAKYSRLQGLKLYALDSNGEPKVIASKDEGEIGTLGGENEKDCIATGGIYYGRDKKTVSVIMPLRDRNGDPIAAARLVMDSFLGQTEQNALARARPIVKEMQERVQTLTELTQ